MKRIFLPLLLVVGACSVAPDNDRPQVPAATHFKEIGDWQKATPADGVVRGDWWRDFGDTALDALEDRLTHDSPSLAAAAARYAQARAAAQYARAGLFPQLSLGGGVQRERRSQTLDPSELPAQATDHLASLDVSWELDFWGRVRNIAAAGAANQAASGGDLAVMELSLRSELAGDFFAIRGADAVQLILDQTVLDEDKAFSLVSDRYKGGVATQADMAEAEAQLQAARTQSADNRLKRAQLEHAISLLIGENPSSFTLSPAPLSGTPPAFAVGLPSTLLERRPDIAAAERRVAVANAQIGVARAAWFPQFDLAALAGFESASTRNWLTAPSAIWAVGPSLALPLFDGGQRAALSDQAHASRDEAVANYRQTVLNAWREVEDQLAVLRQLEQETRSQNAAVTASKTALDQARLRYTGGIVTYLDVVQTQNAALTAQLSSLDILTRQMTADVNLVKALGGGWQNASTGQ